MTYPLIDSMLRVFTAFLILNMVLFDVNVEVYDRRAKVFPYAQRNFTVFALAIIAVMMFFLDFCLLAIRPAFPITLLTAATALWHFLALFLACYNLLKTAALFLHPHPLITALLTVIAWMSAAALTLKFFNWL